jgi:hypothetical protein
MDGRSAILTGETGKLQPIFNQLVQIFTGRAVAHDVDQRDVISVEVVRGCIR